MDYGRFMKRAWEITWNYKFLWIFGIAMAFCRTSGGTNSNVQYNVNNRNLTSQHNFGHFLNSRIPSAKSIENVINPEWFWIFAVILIGLIILFFLISIAVVAFGRGSLIRGVNLIENGAPLNFHLAWAEGKKSFTRLFRLEFFLNLPMLLLGMAIFIIILILLINSYRYGVPLFKGNEEDTLHTLLIATPLILITLCGSIVAALLLQIMVGIFETFSGRAIAIEEFTVKSSFQRGWHVFTTNLASWVILASILFGIGLVLNLAIGLPILLLLGIGLVFMTGLTNLTTPAWFTFLPIFITIILGAVLLNSIVRGIYLVFTESIWTLAYRDFTLPRMDKE